MIALNCIEDHINIIFQYTNNFLSIFLQNTFIIRKKSIPSIFCQFSNTDDFLFQIRYQQGKNIFTPVKLTATTPTCVAFNCFPSAKLMNTSDTPFIDSGSNNLASPTM